MVVARFQQAVEALALPYVRKLARMILEKDVAAEEASVEVEVDELWLVAAPRFVVEDDEEGA